eukprot:CAMPEP_0172082880 /NCGR_PEP_ID=MMETSP1043-20130122/20118_1 /TAXON_ID=464988 /ORGANISM="Hemiselmis andersenii, Strain CCMP441" /LENGTH=70 /DNA_ID=CAMNT_0012744511 /DNA_START=80 /DNA_END=292 /DNA_ORIENTATION=-
MILVTVEDNVVAILNALTPRRQSTIPRAIRDPTRAQLRLLQRAFLVGAQTRTQDLRCALLTLPRLLHPPK